jgi:hypothetical protein
MYVYESTSQYGGQYRSYLPPVGANPGIGNPVLPLGQGFFVRVSAGQTSGALTFRNSQRLTIYQDPVYHRPTTDTRPTVQLTLAGAGLRDTYYLYADPGATPGLDARFDAVKLPNPSGLNLAALTPTGEALAIDGRPAFAPAVSIPLSVGVPSAGSYTLTAATVANLAGTRVELVDNLTNTRTLLTPGATFHFTLAGFTAPGRFWLSLVPTGPLAASSAVLATQMQLFPNPAHAAGAGVTVNLPAQPGTVATATLLNALGQTIGTTALPVAAGQATGHLSTAGLAAGLYVVRVRTAAGEVSRRLVVE